jgi:protein-tyrosine phosphatase
MDSFRNILTAIMHHDFSEGAILWHCTEGKDRCGITTAMILELLDVDRDTIMEDYLKTNLVNLPKAAAIREKLAAERGQEFADSVYQAYIADEKYLRSAWEAIGDVSLPEKLGISAEAVEAFKNTVLE